MANHARKFPMQAVLTRPFYQLVIASGLAVSVLGGLRAASPPKDSPVTADSPERFDAMAFMRAKLASSQLVLEGLVTEDFGLIAKGAREMNKMSEAAEWPRAPDKVYDHFSEEFRRLASKLQQLAATQNLEAASFTYMHMTSTCISCHNYVRGSLRVAEDPDGKPGAVRLIPSKWPE